MPKLFTLNLIIIFQFISFTCLADSIARPRSYEVISFDKKFAFYMNANNKRLVSDRKHSELNYKVNKRKCEEKEHDDSCMKVAQHYVLHGDTDKGVKLYHRLCEDKFKKACSFLVHYDANYYRPSGLYQLDEKGKIKGSPIWTIDFYSYSAFLSKSNDILIVPGPWASTLNQSAVDFYEQGKLLKKHRIKDILDDPSCVSRSVSHFRWKSDAKFDIQKDEYQVSTCDGKKIVFDVNTGLIKRELRVSQPKQKKDKSFISKIINLFR